MKLSTDTTGRTNQLRQWVMDYPDPQDALENMDITIESFEGELEDDANYARAWLHQEWEPEQFKLDEADRRFLREEFTRQYGVA